MFTGLIKEIGSVKKLMRTGDGIDITINSKTVNSDAAVDDSIAVNGVCLTVVKRDAGTFTVQAVRETVAKTNVKTLKANDKVNLEPAVRADDRLGGHIVQKHIDGAGEIVKVIANSTGKEFVIRTDAETIRYIVTKGSVCLDGISLTVAECSGNEFRVAIIPHTLEITTAGSWANGKRINIETDIIGRYIEKLIKGGKENLSLEKLTELGY